MTTPGAVTTSSGRPLSAVVVRTMTPTTPNKPQILPRPVGIPCYNRPTTVVTIPNRPVSSVAPGVAVIKQQQQPNQQHGQGASRKIQLVRNGVE